MELSGAVWHFPTMPRYFFNLRNDLDVDDLEGLDLPNLEAAHVEAVRLTRNMVAVGAQEEGRINLSHRIEVTDSNGTALFTVKFGDAVRIEGPSDP